MPSSKETLAANAPATATVLGRVPLITPEAPGDIQHILLQLQVMRHKVFVVIKPFQYCIIQVFGWVALIQNLNYTCVLQPPDIHRKNLWRTFRYSTGTWQVFWLADKIFLKQVWRNFCWVRSIVLPNITPLTGIFDCLMHILRTGTRLKSIKIKTT